MVLGVGIDLVSVEEFRQLAGAEDDPFRAYTFTERELEYAATKADPIEHLAGFFAVKEAVAKALSQLVADDPFDMRRIETLHRADGSPYLAHTPPLSTAMERAGVGSILISITNERDYASAIAVAQT